jgi:hypothetical protein
MHGYSGTPLPEKLGLRPGLKVYVDGAPDHLDELLGGSTYSTRLPREIDVTLLFSTSLARLERRLPVVIERTASNGMVWVCWPKKAAQRSARNRDGLVSDLDENRVRDLGLELGFVDVKVAAIDDTWSGLKFVRRLVDRS